ncbi:MAG: Flp pilus assembly protein CpaB [Loktanella sp.]|nr:Flp pilus assembly protein CpaB [Loktanella sp.]
MIRATIFLIALASGGGAAWMSASGSGAAPAATIYPDGTTTMLTTEVLVAAHDLPPGSPVDAETMRWQAWPKVGLSVAYITRDLRPDAIQDFNGLVVRSGLIAGEPISDAKFTAGDTGALSVMLSSGRRAVAVRISAENSAGGFVLPNDRVDVLLTTSRPTSSGQNIVNSSLILKNVKVLAVDQTVDGNSDAVVGKTATLELTPAEVEIITAAEVSGSISLALRAMADNGDDSALVTTEKRTLRIYRDGAVEVIDVN